MTTTLASAAHSVVPDVLTAVFGGLGAPPFDVRLWDGTTWRPDDGPPGAETAFTLVFARPSALRQLLRAGSEAALAEAYLSGDIEIEGDIFAVPAVARAVLEKPHGLGERARLALRLRRLAAEDSGERPSFAPPPSDLRAARLEGEVHSQERDRAAVTHHYDLSNRFYSLFLDPALVYSCAVFGDPGEDLATAQERKLDLICRKLRLQPGDRLLDIGCGWGALILHATREYGARCLGITLSERQAELARERIRESGFEDRCRVEVRDYRTLENDNAFDQVASVGMFEHVGSVRAPAYFATIHRLLRPGGAYLHHAITGNLLRPAAVGPTLSQRYVFPDHELIPLGDTVRFAEGAGLEVRDVEILREHYALTLRRWVAALERRREQAIREVGAPTWRAWRLVFAGAAVDFEAGRQGLAQLLMVKPDADGASNLPLGRWDWYDASPARSRTAA